MAQETTMQKMDSKSKIDSFIERRMLFKNIWETAMKIDEKEDVTMKPKIIKTLRLNEMAKQVMTKTKNKKQRIKNLRHVCNKLLDFCDKQDADELFYDQLAAVDLEPDKNKNNVTNEKKIKVKRKIKKISRKKRTISSFDPSYDRQGKPSVSDRKDKDKLSRGDNVKINASNKKSLIQIKNNTSDKMKAQIKKCKPKPKKSNGVKSIVTRETKSSDASAATNRKVVKKKKRIKAFKMY